MKFATGQFSQQKALFPRDNDTACGDIYTGGLPGLESHQFTMKEASWCSGVAMDYCIEVAVSIGKLIVEEFQVEVEDDFIGGVKW